MNLETLRRLSGINAKKEAQKKKTASLAERNELRKLAGLAMLTEEDVTIDDSSADPADLDPAVEEIPSEGEDLTTPNETGSEDEDALVKSLKHIANHAEGKVGQELLDIIRQVYDAGVQDGKAQAEEESAPAEETPENDTETAEETPEDTTDATAEVTDTPESSEEDEEDEEGAKVEESVLVEGPGEWSSITDNLSPVEGATFIIAFSDLDKKLVEDNVRTGMKAKWAFQVVLSGIIHQPSVQNVMNKLQHLEEQMHDATPEQLVRAYHE